MNLTHTDIKKAIIKSQHCQRNWDISKSIPQEDLDLLIHAVTNCPSKQNVAYYEVHVITDRNIIENVHKNTNGFVIDKDGNTTTNSQVLANVLFAFSKIPNNKLDVISDEHRNEQLDKLRNNTLSDTDITTINRDRLFAIGIASGYLNLTASMLGYQTGCCSCFDQSIKDIIGAAAPIDLLMGIGFKDEVKNRRLHHETDFMFPTKIKQPITVHIK